jgi:hypothetical protein
MMFTGSWPLSGAAVSGSVCLYCRRNKADDAIAG